MFLKVVDIFFMFCKKFFFSLNRNQPQAERSSIAIFFNAFLAFRFGNAEGGKNTIKLPLELVTNSSNFFS